MQIEPTAPDHPDAVALIARLSATLAAITGDSGQSSFSADDVSLFVVGRDAGRPVACGAIRAMQGGAELKRMFAEPGYGAEILRYLEDAAREKGHRHLRLSTRVVNQRAVGFYAKHGYIVIPNFGRYVGRDQSVCMEKQL